MARFSLQAFYVVSCLMLTSMTATALRVDSEATANDVTSFSTPSVPMRQLVNTAISELFQMVNQQRYNNSVPFSVLPPQLGHEEGRYVNDIHFNFAGNPLAQELRRKFALPDNNMFTTQFVADALMGAGVLDPELAPLNDTVFEMGLNTSLRHRDKRFSDTTPVFGFWEQEWKQQHIAGDKFGWRQWSINMSPALALGKSATDLLKFVVRDVLHDEKLWKNPIEGFYNLTHWFSTAFNIPPDADDTNTMIAFSHWLKVLPDSVPKTKQLWDEQNFNLSSAFDQIIAASYCPVRNASDFSGSTDTRSFYWAREFIWNLTHDDDCIVSTWIETYPYMLGIFNKEYAGPINPLNVNNIDSSVCANTLFGMSVALLKGDNDSTAWFTRADEKGRRLYLTTAKLVAFALQTQSTQQRPDFEMLYYPAVVNFPYFVARHLRLLESTPRPFPFPEMQEVYELLANASRQGGVTYFLEGMKIEDCGYGNNGGGDSGGVLPNQNTSAQACWDGFLGQGDTDNAGNSTPHYDDRFYTTAVAVNSLLDAWTKTTEVNGSGLVWIDGVAAVPAVVTTMIERGTNYLLNNYKGDNVSKANTFFSGSVKSENGLNIFVPANYMRNMETKEVVQCANVTAAMVYDWTIFSYWAVNGVWPKSEYEKHLPAGQRCGQILLWTEFEGYNKIGKPWPFWSAPVLSDAYAMLALTKVKALGLGGF